MDKNLAHDRALEKLKQNSALIAAHSTGSGKTSLAWRAADEIATPKGNTLMVVPAGLVSNMQDTKKKFNFKSNPTIISYERAANSSSELAKKAWDLVVFDEAHRLRNPGTKRVEELKKVIGSAKNTLLLTADPGYNKPEDIGKLINIATKGKVAPGIAMKREVHVPSFLDRVLKGAKTTVTEELLVPPKDKTALAKYVHVYNPAQTDKKDLFPGVKEQLVVTPMSKQQRDLYQYYERKLSPELRWKIKHNIPATKADAAQLSVFANSFRQISNGTDAFLKGTSELSPKFTAAISRLKEAREKTPNFRAVVYSNYLESGLNPYKAELTKRGIPFAEVTGALSAKEKSQAVENYNKGKAPILLISSAGGEGLDLKGTKYIQVLEPHFNRSKINQVIGRGSRFKSHVHLPKPEQTVLVEHYLSQPFKGQTGIDEYLYNSSMAKNEQNAIVLNHAEKYTTPKAA